MTFQPFLLSAALLVTLIPFYHGALRHLDEQYAGAGARQARGFVLVDFLVLFLESCVFLALAVSIARPEVFGWLFFCASRARRGLGLPDDKVPSERI